jgi:hypothetical protein
MPLRFRSPVPALAAVVLSLGLAACGEEPATGPGAPDFYSKHGGPSKRLQVSLDPASLPASLAIDGAAFSYAIDIVNSYQGLRDVHVTLEVEQTAVDRRQVESFFVDCGAGTGYVPAKSTCRMVRSGAVVSNSASGVGTLVPGSGLLVLTWYEGVGRKETIINSEARGIPLTAP